MTLSIEIFEKGKEQGTFEFETAPRVGETVEKQGGGRWQVVEVRHLLKKGAPTQLQIAVQQS